MAKKVGRESFVSNKIAYSIIGLGVIAILYFIALLPGIIKSDNHASSIPLLTKVTKFQSKLASPSATPKKVTAPVISYPVAFGKSVRVPILMYHYIGNNPNPADKARDALSIAPDVFEEQLSYLQKNGYNPISLDTLYAALKGGSLPPKPIVLTFDDGYIDFYINAFPILRSFNFKATSFIPTGLMNQGYYMSWSQIKEIQSSGLVSFEAHTIHHVNLPSLNPKAQQVEIAQSKKDLEAQIGVPVNFFAYPYGTSNQISWNLVKSAGFAGAVGTWYGSIESEGTQYDWPRIRIGGGLKLSDFASKL